MKINDQYKQAVQVGQDLLSRLKGEVEIARVYAYGSRVRGNASPESDLDLLIELKELNSADKRKVRDMAWELGLSLGLVISVVVVAEEDFEKGVLGRSTFAESVKQEGILITA